MALLREVTGYIAVALLAAYWVGMISCTAAQLRSTSRSGRLRVQVALIKTAGIAITAVLVGIIHFWATQWWHIVVALLVAGPVGIALRHLHKRLVIAPRHRRALVQRARVSDLIDHNARGAPDVTRIRRADQLLAAQDPGRTGPRHRTVPVPPRPATAEGGLQPWWASPADPAPPDRGARDAPGRVGRDSTAPW